MNTACVERITSDSLREDTPGLTPDSPQIVLTVPAAVFGAVAIGGLLGAAAGTAAGWAVADAVFG
ncbi:hypothetical protein AAH978_21290 [Streptomyces sp. ZYX-F-203]